jgi:hypothetical protein
MKRKAMFFIFLSLLAGLSLGSVRKAEDPVRDAQTNSILYEQKKEEEKDGKKGPLMYHVKNNPHESFFIDPPFEKETKSSSAENVTEVAPATEETAGWWEEQPTTAPAVPSTETVAGLLPTEPAPETEQARGSEAVEPTATVPEADKAPAGKGEDYWW